MNTKPYSKNFLSFLILLFASSSWAQSEEVISGLIQDTEGNPISYVNVGVVGTSTGTVSQEDGKYSLYFREDMSENDTVRFSIIGYKSQSYPIKELSDKKNIILEDEIFELSEVVVRPEFNNRKIAGHPKVKGKRNVNFSISQKPRQNLGSEIGKLFKVKNTPTKIESLRFYIRSNNFSKAKFRISFYSTQKRMPHKHLTDQEIIVTIDNKKTGWIDVDLSVYDIMTSSDFIATIQWIDASADGRYLAMPIKFPVFGKSHYYKYGSQAKWKRYKNMSISMSIELAY